MSDTTRTKVLIESSVDRVQHWVETHSYKGYEPFDGLSSWFRPIARGNLMGERLLLQLIRQSPVNIRPIMGVTPKESTKGRGYMAAGYLSRYRTTDDAEYLRKAESCLDWLDAHKAKKFAEHSWSNHFDFASRGGSYTKDDPIIVWTSLIGFAYLDCYDQTKNSRWLEIADSVCRWIVKLPREKTAYGNCLSYLAHAQSSIHNSNMLGAAMLARTAKHTGNHQYFEVARSAMEYSCTRQLPDGSWWYGESSQFRWIDNFHTGYNLDSLATYMESAADNTWALNFRRGLEFYKMHFFEDDGCPKYYHNRRYPVDSQCVAQSIETLTASSVADPDCLGLAVRVARWAIENMQGRDGHFFYRIYPFIKAKTPMLHWSQATMYKGLALLLETLMQNESLPLTRSEVAAPAI
jgi:rhamnogalacturonyl hydrolase YesR